MTNRQTVWPVDDGKEKCSNRLKNSKDIIFTQLRPCFFTSSIPDQTVGRIVIKHLPNV